MKKIIFVVIYLISTHSFATSLIWATGNDYYNTCYNLNASNIDECLNVATAYFDAARLYIPYENKVNIDCFEKTYGIEKVSAGDAHHILIGFLKDNPDIRKYNLSFAMGAFFHQNYPLPKSCFEKPKKQ